MAVSECPCQGHQVLVCGFDASDRAGALIVAASTTFEVGFSFFLLAMLVLVVAVVRFAIRQDRIARGKASGAEDAGDPIPDGDSSSQS